MVCPGTPSQGPGKVGQGLPDCKHSSAIHSLTFPSPLIDVWVEQDILEGRDEISKHIYTSGSYSRVLFSVIKQVGIQWSGRASLRR